MKKIFYIFILLSFLISCTSFDVDKKIKNSGAGIQSSDPEYPQDIASILGTETQVIEKPVYVPAAEAVPSRPQAGDQTVIASNRAGVVRPQDYSHAAIIYDYNQDFVYEIYTQPLRVTDVSLQPSERIVEAPFVSDSERWILGAGVSYENELPVQHVYIKPTSSGLSASLIINTDRRVYRIILRSYANTHMPVVRWRYLSSLPSNFIPAPRVSSNPSDSGIDPRFLSFNYRITRNAFSRPNWLPELVFDDGSKTYITFPVLVLQRELPTVFENRNDVLNYRVSGNVIIIDKLIENISVRIGRSEITIRKKRN